MTLGKLASLVSMPKMTNSNKQILLEQIFKIREGEGKEEEKGDGDGEKLNMGKFTRLKMC